MRLTLNHQPIICKVPLVCVLVTFCNVLADRFVYEISVTFAKTPFPSAAALVPDVGSVFDSATLNVSAFMSILLARLTTKSFTFCKTCHLSKTPNSHSVA